ncbi:isocitrate lyase/PEP mutase family protein [Coralliovum pocilloporae]|uniref:isocitrate lyase/PEP mutase family protein n=1 Tax=Coralliovum pocilloporae TaxID=3066369 RepID=UPI003307B871
MTTSVSRLRSLLDAPGCQTMPCAFDALSARLIEQAGFPVAFMSGFGVSASRIGAPDTGLISFAEMADQGRNICASVSIPVIGDGDTGYGNPLNVERTVRAYAQAGFAAIMLEDQVAPKRCGHTKGKLVVERDEALDRIRAAVHARNTGADILILARTDARHQHGLGEAIERANLFREIGADILFVEAPQSVEEMKEIGRSAPGPHLANMLEGGKTPLLGHQALGEMGFKLSAYPLTLLSAAMKAMTEALDRLKDEATTEDLILPFEELKDRVGFNDYYEAEQRYSAKRPD